MQTRLLRGKIRDAAPHRLLDRIVGVMADRCFRRIFGAPNSCNRWFRSADTDPGENNLLPERHQAVSRSI